MIICVCGVTLSIVFAGLYFTIQHNLNCVNVKKKIVEIGGCDRNRCAIRYGDGSVAYEHLPLIGQVNTICEIRKG
jgi:hypothetical protein